VASLISTRTCWALCASWNRTLGKAGKKYPYSDTVTDDCIGFALPACRVFLLLLFVGHWFLLLFSSRICLLFAVCLPRCLPITTYNFTDVSYEFTALGVMRIALCGSRRAISRVNTSPSARTSRISSFVIQVQCSTVRDILVVWDNVITCLSLFVSVCLCVCLCLSLSVSLCVRVTRSFKLLA
jgi:hypothetical protein